MGPERDGDHGDVAAPEFASQRLRRRSVRLQCSVDLAFAGDGCPVPASCLDGLRCLTAEPLVALLTISASDPTEQHLYTSDCAAISDEGLLLGLDGNIYLAGTNQWTMFRKFGDMPESAIAKFDMGSQSFDSNYCQSIPDLIDGHEAGTLIAYAPGEFVVRAVDESLTQTGDSGTYWADIENACRFYHGTIDEDGQLTIEEEPDLGTSPHYCWGWVYKVDGSPYFWGEDTMFKWDGSRMVPTFKAPGFAAAFQRIE